MDRDDRAARFRGRSTVSCPLSPCDILTATRFSGAANDHKVNQAACAEAELFVQMNRGDIFLAYVENGRFAALDDFAHQKGHQLTSISAALKIRMSANRAD